MLSEPFTSAWQTVTKAEEKLGVLHLSRAQAAHVASASLAEKALCGIRSEILVEHCGGAMQHMRGSAPDSKCSDPFACV